MYWRLWSRPSDNRRQFDVVIRTAARERHPHLKLLFQYARLRALMFDIVFAVEDGSSRRHQGCKPVRVQAAKYNRHGFTKFASEINSLARFVAADLSSVHFAYWKDEGGPPLALINSLHALIVCDRGQQRHCLRGQCRPWNDREDDTPQKFPLIQII